MSYELLKEMFQARRTLFIALVLLAALDAALYAYGSLWQEPRLKRAQQAYLSGRELGKGGAERQKALLYRSGVRDFAAFEQRVLDKKDFTKFLGELYDLARDGSLSVKTLSYRPAPVKDDQRMVEYALTLTVEGKYPAVKNFIAELSRLPQIVTVDSLGLSNSSKTQELVELRLQLTAYLKTEGA